MIGTLLGELRARGLELRVDGTKLRVLGPPAGYSFGLRARLLACKPELLDHLRREAERAAAQYDRDERAWASDYLRHIALAGGYDAALAHVAAGIVATAPPRSPFRIERDVIVIAMGEGCEVRVHRESQT